VNKKIFVDAKSECVEKDVPSLPFLEWHSIPHALQKVKQSEKLIIGGKALQKKNKKKTEFTRYACPAAVVSG
jgi:hypothetical protein